MGHFISKMSPCVQNIPTEFLVNVYKSKKGNMGSDIYKVERNRGRHLVPTSGFHMYTHTCMLSEPMKTHGKKEGRILNWEMPKNSSRKVRN